MIFKQKKKRVYDETVSLIADLGFRNKISIEEMNFLLNLLDIIFFKPESDFKNILKQWADSNSGSEIDEIIKATLLATDISDSSSLQQSAQLIKELLEARE
jgi:hypothetical protein